MSNPCPRDVILLKKLVPCEPRARSLHHWHSRGKNQQWRRQKPGTATSQQTLRDGARKRHVNQRLLLKSNLIGTNPHNQPTAATALSRGFAVRSTSGFPKHKLLFPMGPARESFSLIERLLDVRFNSLTFGKFGEGFSAPGREGQKRAPGHCSLESEPVPPRCRPAI
jgi:hypothetical protein